MGNYTCETQAERAARQRRMRINTVALCTFGELLQGLWLWVVVRIGRPVNRRPR